MEQTFAPARIVSIEDMLELGLIAEDEREFYSDIPDHANLNHTIIDTDGKAYRVQSDIFSKENNRFYTRGNFIVWTYTFIDDGTMTPPQAIGVLVRVLTDHFSKAGDEQTFSFVELPY